MTSSWFFLSTLNYDARSTTHHILMYLRILIPISVLSVIPLRSQQSCAHLWLRHCVILLLPITNHFDIHSAPETGPSYIHPSLHCCRVESRSTCQNPPDITNNSSGNPPEPSLSQYPALLSKRRWRSLQRQNLLTELSHGPVLRLVIFSSSGHGVERKIC